MIKLTIKTQTPDTEQKVYNYEFDQPVITLGRLNENDIQLPASTVSGYHAQILAEGESYYLVDRGSINGTQLNSHKLLPGEKKLLQDGDSIHIQGFDIYFMIGGLASVDQGATVQVARKMVMELLGSWETQQEPRLIVMGGPNGGQAVQLSEGKTVAVGRGSNCDIVIEHPTISRKHAEISFTWNGAFLKDLESANGAYVNDLRITGSARLRDRDEIRLGQANNPDAIRLIFSNPAEALLSKIEEEQQSTDSNLAVGAKKGEQEAPAAPGEETPPPPPSPPPTQPASAEASVPPPQTPSPSPSAPADAKMPVRRKQVAPMIAAIVVLILTGAAVLYFAGKSDFFAGKRAPVQIQISPEKAMPGNTVTIQGKGLDFESVQSANLMGRIAPIVQRDSQQLKIKIPAFPNLDAGEKTGDLRLDGKNGVLAQASFMIVIPPEIESINPVLGLPGSEVKMEFTGTSAQTEIYFGPHTATVITSSGREIIFRVPEFPDFTNESGETFAVKAKVNGVLSKNTMNFTLFPGAFVRLITPESGTVGTEVKVAIHGGTEKAAVFFGDIQAEQKSAGEAEMVVIVPPPSDPIPATGLSLPVVVRVADLQIAGSKTFTVFPEAVKPVLPFQLRFHAAPYPSALGFNEYAVYSNFGPLLILVSRGSNASSQARAESTAENLNSALDLFRTDPSAAVTGRKDAQGMTLYAEGTLPEQRRMLVQVFSDDALAYGKINQRVVSPDALAEWWRMLIDSYYKVFVQLQSPAGTGILSAGGSILQQIYSFYSIQNEQGQKYFKSDLLDSLQPDQKHRLTTLSVSPPRKISGVDGKWTGRMSNNLYSNISDPDLELILTLQQKNDTVSGSAEMNWKIGMGESKGGFQNVAYKRLGVHKVNGMYQKNQTIPLQFSFVEKDGRLLKFVGKLEGDALTGSYVVQSTGEEGTWTVRLRN